MIFTGSDIIRDQRITSLYLMLPRNLHTAVNLIRHTKTHTDFFTVAFSHRHTVVKITIWIETTVV